jgi:hypothetical protein
MLDATLRRLGPQWTVIPSAQIDAAGVFSVVLVHPACGVALLDPVQGLAPAMIGKEAVARFRGFLEHRAFTTSYPGYLPIVALPTARLMSADPCVALIEAFANLPLLTIKDSRWADALIRLLRSENANDRPASHPSDRESDRASIQRAPLGSSASKESPRQRDMGGSTTSRPLRSTADPPAPLRLEADRTLRIERDDRPLSRTFWIGLVLILGAVATTAVTLERKEGPVRDSILAGAAPPAVPNAQVPPVPKKMPPPAPEKAPLPAPTPPPAETNERSQPPARVVDEYISPRAAAPQTGDAAPSIAASSRAPRAKVRRRKVDRARIRPLAPASNEALCTDCPPITVTDLPPLPASPGPDGD